MFLSAMALTDELIFRQCQLKFKANRDVGSITEVAVLKVGGTNEIRGALYGDFRNSGKPSASELKTKQEIGGNSRGEYIGPNRPIKCSSFQNYVGKAQFPPVRFVEISGNEMHGMWK